MRLPAATTRYTLEDLERFPDDGNRYELLHGELFVTPAPRSGHEHVITELVDILIPALSVPRLAWVCTRGTVTCRPSTQFEPDLLVLPPHYRGDHDWADITERWLVVEVQSPSTRKLDATVKRTAYFDLGVRNSGSPTRATAPSKFAPPEPRARSSPTSFAGRCPRSILSFPSTLRNCSERDSSTSAPNSSRPSGGAPPLFHFMRGVLAVHRRHTGTLLQDLRRIFRDRLRARRSGVQFGFERREMMTDCSHMSLCALLHF